MINTTYRCEDSGHIMGPWHTKKGLPKPTRARVCVVPTCSPKYIEEEEAPRA